MCGTRLFGLRRALPLAVALAASPAGAKEGFVFLGATGDNALRPSGVWSGLFEAFAGGVFDAGSVGIHVAMNTPHTVSELHADVVRALAPLYEELQHNPGWTCRAKGGDCRPERLLQDVIVSIWAGRDAAAQAANMTASLASYGRVTVYLSVPPFVFGSWSKAAVDNWGEGEKHRVHVAAEKPFGTSLEDADQLHRQILDAGVPEGNLHLVDHWLSFFMNVNLPAFRSIVQPRLGIEWSGQAFSRVVVTEFETRGLEGRGGFFDGVGQVRDMVQSHLLQVLALALVDPAAEPRSEAKLAVLNKTAVTRCDMGQYSGFLFEPKLKYHGAFADSTLVEVSLSSVLPGWEDVELAIATGKDMGTTLYTVEFFQRDGPGVLTYEIGKEETGAGGIRVRSWPLKDSSSFEAPAPGFGQAKTMQAKPSVSPSGDGYILQYGDPGLYFPKPYAVMAAALLQGDYGSAFVTYPECRRGWEVVTASSAAACLDPAPKDVAVYKPPAACGHTPPAVCWQRLAGENETVKDLYDGQFRCSSEHDAMYGNVSLYQAKCHKAAGGSPLAGQEAKEVELEIVV